MTDALNGAIGALLTQKGNDRCEHLIAYALKRLALTEQ